MAVSILHGHSPSLHAARSHFILKKNRIFVSQVVDDECPPCCYTVMWTPCSYWAQTGSAPSCHFTLGSSHSEIQILSLDKLFLRSCHILVGHLVISHHNVVSFMSCVVPISLNQFWFSVVLFIRDALFHEGSIQGKLKNEGTLLIMFFSHYSQWPQEKQNVTGTLNRRIRILILLF